MGVSGPRSSSCSIRRAPAKRGASPRGGPTIEPGSTLVLELSGEYVEQHPPESLTFDPAEFRDLVDSGARIYEMVAARDGTTEKLEAARRLEAFLAFSLAVDRDRFTP